MTLKELQEKYGIKRIDFGAIEIPKDAVSPAFATDKVECPYCGANIEFGSEETKYILDGTLYECPECEMQFSVSGDISVNTYAHPIESRILDCKRYSEMDDIKEFIINIICGVK